MKPLEQSGFLISETEDINVATEKNNLGFGILMLMLQTGVCLVYGFLGNIPPNVLNIQSVFITVMHGLLVIAGTSHCYVGFGLLFSYLKKLTWTGLGFTFLITALSIEFYPLFNAFWTRVNIPGYTFQGTPNFTTSTINFNLHLTNAESRNYTFGNTITMAIKCGLACSIGFSSILGRSGFLEATLVALIGGAGFELNRTIIMLYGADLTGTYFIFTYGGFMSLALAVLMKIR